MVIKRWFLCVLLLAVVLYVVYTFSSMDLHQVVPWGWKYYSQDPNGTGNILVNHMISCVGLFEGNEAVQSATMDLSNHWKYVPSTPTQYVTWTKNCAAFIRDRQYIMTISDAESALPIAFSILVYRDIEQMERLLRVIYRPSNFYCIHVDSKAATDFRDGVKGIADCFDNVFLSSRSVSVIWGTFTVLEPELICISDLLKRPSWRYFINLTGQEFPLKTNRELVQILNVYGGANDIEGTTVNIPDRKQRWGSAGKLPHGLTPVKGAVHIVANRDFVTYAVNSTVGLDLLAWVKKTIIPDETFFSTLNHNSQLNIPGTYNGTGETKEINRPFVARYKLWVYNDGIMIHQCFGKYVHHICVFGVRDLPKLIYREELFTNKFYADFEPLAYDCMEQRYFSKVRAEQCGNHSINTQFYESLGFVKNRIRAL
ncbi:beta-1,3-galactosyl-O-glycosyl-glycoprotein beta-1,6-N-acetylglucosaminyltransferase-like [Gigantopelta aegis]|uniref:beta-1,3-galactosyl-O-glycosyl-glycoprotein beta-1,6-N-acetylglucosaminyltransferase-like n=1 Tax=Gigantopelta aegis TaxID=1735272 RepID=UPI001B887D5F|nr:beta-1,3-galactosyl-O-glycosyl-glycoprotein beta-1,6-N-acetylglucosaminyltransferase-like [Gigantopelta aegis]